MYWLPDQGFLTIIQVAQHLKRALLQLYSCDYKI